MKVLRNTVATLAIALAATAAGTAPADAAVVGVDECSAPYNADGVRGECRFVAIGGTYLLTITSNGATYSWSRVTCEPSGPRGNTAMVSIEGSGTNSKTITLPPGICILEVAGTGGTAFGTVQS